MVQVGYSTRFRSLRCKSGITKLTQVEVQERVILIASAFQRHGGVVLNLENFMRLKLKPYQLLLEMHPLLKGPFLNLVIPGVNHLSVSS